MPGANFAALIMGSAAQGRTWEFVGSASSTDSASVNISSVAPGTEQAGDLCIYIQYTRDNASVSAVTPSGFTDSVSTGFTGATENARGMISYKELAGGEGAVTGMAVGDGAVKLVLVFRPSEGFSAVDDGTPDSQMTDANPSSDTITVSGETDAVILIGVAASASTSAAFSTASPAWDDEFTVTAAVDGSQAEMVVGYKIYNSSPSNHTVDAGDMGSSNWLSTLFYKVS